MSRCHSALLLLCALGWAAGCNKGVALDVTVQPNCVTTGGTQVAQLAVTITVTGADKTPVNKSYTFSASTFFASNGSSNRFVVVLPSDSTYANVAIEAQDADNQALGFGEHGFTITGANIYSDTIELGNAECPVPVDGGVSPGDGGGAGGGGGVTTSRITPVNGSAAMSLGSVTTLSIMQPDTTMTGDLLVAVLDFNSSGTGPNVTAPPDWTLIGNATCETNRLYTANFYWHVVADEPGPYVFSVDQSALMNAAIGAYRGASATAPVAAHMTMADNQGDGFTVPSVNVPANGAMAVVFVDYPNSAVNPMWTAPGSMATRFTNGEAAIFDQPVAGPSTFTPGTPNLTAVDSCAVTANIILQ